ncbi:disulfide bond formation protein DsbA [Dermabacter sp. p3-SID358]|uniref:mycothiol-dependent nitroreductase Rv2466c family protein n=1 Tax=Dermabacter sp. p3-SID358 TaxID=2916114 RepID=UPI0021A2BD59|nr:disulfide bond formation protein DsbA [Dermabacter sp. p3-SID358]MCT1867328.1 disulfide bond formation protein DsbA [Dermabacter sp. p3-SID358]
MSATNRDVLLYIDPTCPFAWVTSRWLLHAVKERPEYTPCFSIMSLYVLNEGRDLDPNYRALIDQTLSPAHLFMAVQRELGQEAFSKLYTAWGERFHVQDRKDDYLEIARESLEEAGIDASYLEHWEGRTYEAELREEQAKVQKMVGDDVGTPVISFGSGTAYFGPVLTRAPRGEEAGALLDGLAAMTTVRGFSELKRARTGGLDFS